VLRYILRQLPARLGRVPRFDIYCGTSVGAVHSCYLAATADAPEESIQKLEQIWRGMSFADVYRFGLRDALTFSQMLFGSVSGKPVDTSEHPARIHGLLNTEPLEHLVVGNIPWRRLRRNLRQGVFSALCISTTEIATGRTVVFVDTPEREVPSWTRDTGVVARASIIGPTHALASAAIPFLFPAVRIGRTYYCDGGVRMHSPLSPALRLGANRVLIVGMSRGRLSQEHDARTQERVKHFLSASFLFGKVLDALLMDRIENDLAHMRLLNQILSAGTEAFGPEFLTRVNAIAERTRGLGFRPVGDCFIRPSEDIGMIAAQHVARLRRAPARSWLGGMAFRTLTRGSPEEEADLLSYLLFEGEYAAELMDLGRSDAERHEEELLRFFSDEADTGAAATA
jgi:NTE family protein